MHFFLGALRVTNLIHMDEQGNFFFEKDLNFYLLMSSKFSVDPDPGPTKQQA